jgi:dihydroorotase
MKGADLVVSGGTLVTPETIFDGDLRIVNGKIVELGKNLAISQNVVDATGLFILPGVIDSHVHMRDPGLTEFEDFGTGTAAAAAGGVTTVLEMPNTLPPVDSTKNVKEKKDRIATKAVIDFGLFGVLHDSNLDQVPDMIKSGVVGLKAFMGPTTGNIPPPSDATVFEALLLSNKFGFPIAFHAENASMIAYYTALVKQMGRVDARAHCDSRPAICEIEAINRISFLTLKSQGHGHVVHVSTGEGVKIISEYKKLGASVTCETNPQYLSMTEEDQDRYGSLAKINPPLRTSNDRSALWEGIDTGVIDTLGSDHAPHPVERKKEPNIWDAPSGFIGVETLVPIMMDFVAKGRITLQKLASLTSQNPAMLYKLWPNKGRIGLGADGDLTIVELGKEHFIKAQELHSKQKITPFDGQSVNGVVKYTIVRGNIVYDGNVGPPAGEWVRPS